MIHLNKVITSSGKHECNGHKNNYEPSDKYCIMRTDGTCTYDHGMRSAVAIAKVTAQAALNGRYFHYCFLAAIKAALPVDVAIATAERIINAL